MLEGGVATDSHVLFQDPDLEITPDTVTRPEESFTHVSVPEKTPTAGVEYFENDPLEVGMKSHVEPFRVTSRFRPAGASALSTYKGLVFEILEAPMDVTRAVRAATSATLKIREFLSKASDTDWARALNTGCRGETKSLSSTRRIPFLSLVDTIFLFEWYRR